ncbi:nucleotidyltransferase family protein [Uliginosibacterium sp. 31-16]|uniref:nucleotidyltransferase family protein n=1 Tax=Uliginosibacterium sp. 31-16 TaxID=3068315 RepID=UPI00273D2F42|nr:nucleotidyltransferase family protein [Uliginosibacterium sp. 31-16]MDP5240647.1 nucleotidyltransferase family protein [Uliginosibacterium sp. 31-16]
MPIRQDRDAENELEARFLRDVLSNRHNRAILACWDELALPDGWLVAGCLFQTVWNIQAGQPPEAHIKDYDLFYFDPSDLSEAGERKVQAHVESLLGGLGVTVEAINQARVHLWYESHFGQAYAPLHSSREGIDRFLIPSTCVGIRPGSLYAPNGLRLLYDGILSPNPLTPHQELFERKAASYRSRWPGLTITHALSHGPAAGATD